MKKGIKFEAELIKLVQDYADLHYGGNFTLAVNKLLHKGLLS